MSILLRWVDKRMETRKYSRIRQAATGLLRGRDGVGSVERKNELSECNVKKGP